VTGARAPAGLPPGLRLLRRLEFPHKLGLLERLYGRRLARLGIAWVRTAAGVVWKLDLRNPTHRWCVFGDYEGAWVRWARRALAASPGVVIDSGANIGQTVLQFGPLPGVEVYAFEPMPAARDWLRACLEAYPDWSCEVVPYALADAPGTRDMLEAGGGEIHGGWSTLHTQWYAGRGFETRAVQAVRLDDFARRRAIPRIRLWKLDVEGAELDALRGATALLERHCVDALFVEMHPATRTRTLELLCGYGYAPHGLAGRRVKALTPQQASACDECLFLAGGLQARAVGPGPAPRAPRVP